MRRGATSCPVCSHVPSRCHQEQKWLTAALEEYMTDEVSLMKDCVAVLVREDATDVGFMEAMSTLPHVEVDAATRAKSAAGKTVGGGAAAATTTSGGAGGASTAMMAALEDVAKSSDVTPAAKPAEPAGDAAGAAAGEAAGETAGEAAGGGDATEGDAGAALETKEAEVDDGLPLLSAKEQALDRLAELVETIDRGRDLHLIGGLRPVIACVCSSHSSVAWRAANVLATAVQNNPKAQDWAYQFGVVPVLLRAMDPATEHDDEKVRVKALTATSAVIRGLPAGTAAFLDGGGAEILVKLLQRPIPPVEPDTGGDDEEESPAELRRREFLRVRRKAGFFLMHMAAPTTPGVEDARGSIVRAGVAGAAAAALASGDFEVQENIAKMLAYLVSGKVTEPLVDVDGLGAAVRARLAELESHTGEDREFEAEERIALTAVSSKLAAAA